MGHSARARRPGGKMGTERGPGGAGERRENVLSESWAITVEHGGCL